MLEALEKALAKFKADLDAVRNSKKTPEQIEKAKELYDSLDPGDRSFLEYIFPEVVETEDERIRKHLVEIVEIYWGKTNDPDKAKDLAYLEKQKEQKSAEWSSVDELKLQTIEAVITQQKGSAAFGGFLQEELIDFLESLRSQPKAEWSEEDEKFFELLHAALYQMKVRIGKDEYDRAVDRLKSLRPRPHWKPSDEQMIELRAAISGCSFDTKTLSSLEKDLKKLM